MISIRKITLDQSKNGKTLMDLKQGPSNHHPFQFSKKLDYGLFLMIELAKLLKTDVQKNGHADPLSLRVVADQNQMSFFFLQKVALCLRQAGLIEASRGKNGGYLLRKNPDSITVKEIVEALEGSVAIMHCLTPDAQNPENLAATCTRENQCSMRSGLEFLNQMLLNLLSQTSLSQLLSYEKTANSPT